METKICSKCKEEKYVCEFYKHNKNPEKYRSTCKTCMNIASKKYKVENFDKIHKKNKEYLEKNREQNKLKCRIYRNNNIEARREAFRVWRRNNKEKIKKYNQQPIVKLKNSLRSRINELMNRKYNNPKTINLVGCDYDFLISYIESKFSSGMNWDNYGYYGWHIDHIIPLSSAKNEEELKKLFHHTNLQPLWAKDNLSKGKKIL
jgi:hypothetical protein